jgi:RNA polymerase sigma factor (TIGR02999 family)
VSAVESRAGINIVKGFWRAYDALANGHEMTTQITRLLDKLRCGDRSAVDELMPLVYNELRRIAQSRMRRQPPGHTLQPTALVNEAFLKVFGQDPPQLADRAHFLALMSRAIRQVLVDHARARSATKRGGAEARRSRVTNLEIAGTDVSDPVKLLDLHRALEGLGADNHVLAEIVEMFYFGGMTAEEIATAVGRSAHVVRHELRAGRAWLRRELAR